MKQSITSDNTLPSSQIFVQLSSIAPQNAIPSTLPPPFSPFSPFASDDRVNVFWFMALAFSLLEALLPSLVRQWVHKYMHVFQRYGDPLKSSRLAIFMRRMRRWYMPKVVEAVPGFLHVFLFLFFVGLGDSLLNININTKVVHDHLLPEIIFGLDLVFVPKVTGPKIQGSQN